MPVFKPAWLTQVPGAGLVPAAKKDDDGDDGDDGDDDGAVKEDSEPTPLVNCL